MTRLFRYPVSYLIYSPAFTGLPQELKRETYELIQSALRTETATAAVLRLNVDERRVLREILQQTIDDWPIGLMQ